MYLVAWNNENETENKDGADVRKSGELALR